MTSDSTNISSKANRVLSFIALALFLILIRVWYLSILQHDVMLEQAHKPQRKVVIEPVERAPIYDRFGIPLAINKIQYNISVCYANIRQLPSVRWERDASGKRVRTHPRLRHIETIAQLLAKELGLNSQDIEDIIYGKASLLPHTPFVIKEDITETQYYRLKMLEKDFLGIQTQRVAKRFYPQGKVGCDVIGYLGKISSEKYYKIAEEIHTLEEYLKKREENENPFLPSGFTTPVEVRERLMDLQEKSYSLNDLVGQTGIERFYEEELRGLHGKKIYEIDIKGNFLRELPGSKEPLSGKKINLALSAELQAFAEQLLSAYESSPETEVPYGLHEKWMHGGAIVALDPQTGEVLALASYPRFDPNDFISTSREALIKKQKEEAIQRWLETETYIGQIWDGKRSLEKESFSFSTGKYQEQKIQLSWPLFLSSVLPEKGALRAAMEKITDLNTALEVQIQGCSHPYLHSIAPLQDQLLALDLCSLIAPQELFPPSLVQVVGNQTLSSHFLYKQTALRILSLIKTQIQELYHDYDFANWRKSHFKEYLNRKREHEKKTKKYAKPYTDYLDAAEKQMFQAFWKNYSFIFLYTTLSGASPIALEDHPDLYPYLAYLKGISISVSEEEKAMDQLKTILAQLSIEEGLGYLKTFLSFNELTKPLRSAYPNLRTSKDPTQKTLASSFYPRFGYSYGRSHAYRQIHAQGSVFKIVTAYQALMERYELYKNGKTNSLLPPLTLIDDLKGDPRSSSLSQVLGYTENGTPILRYYKGGVLPRSSHSGIGKINLVSALEQSSNIYFSLLAADFLKDPLDLSRAAESFGFGKKTGIDLPFEAQGHVPFDLNDRTKIYSFAIGHHTLAVTPLQTAVMLSTLANEGKVLKPHMVKTWTGQEVLRKNSLFAKTRFPFQETLALLGINFPLFTLAQEEDQKSFSYTPQPEIVRSVELPPGVLNVLQQSLQQTVLGLRGSSRPSIMRNVYHHPTAVKDYYEVAPDIITKTGTAQFFYKHSLDKATMPEIKRHVWFGAISYTKKFESPELVVVVYSKFRNAGREGGPMAAQLIKKWREIKKTHLQAEKSNNPASLIP